MLPWILILPFMLPISSAQSELAGITRAIGLPCFVTTISSGSRFSRIARHCSLNFNALIFCISSIVEVDNIDVQSLKATNSKHHQDYRGCEESAIKMKIKIEIFRTNQKAHLRQQGH